MKTEKKRQYDSTKSRKSLTDAAIDLFSRIGYDAATTKGIAQKAGVNESLIQRYFVNKFGLFSSIVTDYKNKLHRELPYPPADTVEEEIRSFLIFRRELSKSQKKVNRLVLSRALVDRKVCELMRMSTQNGLPVLIERLKILQDRGLIGENFHLASVSLLIGSISFSFGVWGAILNTMDAKATEELITLAASVLAQGMAK